MAKRLLAAIALVLGLSFGVTSQSWAVGAVVTAPTTAGGISVVPANNGWRTLQLINTGGTNVADCLIAGSSNAVVSASNYDFQLAASSTGQTWTAPTLLYAPNQLGAPRVAGSEGISCIAISGSTTIKWYAR